MLISACKPNYLTIRSISRQQLSGIQIGSQMLGTKQNQLA